MLKITKRILVATLSGFLISLAGFLYIGSVLGFNSSVAWGVLLWYTFIGFLIGLAGTLDKHPILGFRLIFLRGALIAGVLNLSLALIAKQEFQNFFSSLPFGIEYISIIEGIIVGVIIDAIATKIGGEGKELLNEKK